MSALFIFLLLTDKYSHTYETISGVNQGRIQEFSKGGGGGGGGGGGVLFCNFRRRPWRREFHTLRKRKLGENRGRAPDAPP